MVAAELLQRYDSSEIALSVARTVSAGFDERRWQVLEFPGDITSENQVSQRRRSASNLRTGMVVAELIRGDTHVAVWIRECR